MIIPPVKVVDGGRIVPDVFSLILAQIRSKHETGGDLRAQVAANATGVRRVQALVGRHGRDAIVEFFAGANHPSAHHVTNIVVSEEDGEVRVHSKFLAPYTRPSHDPRRWYGGDYHDVVVATPDGWRFAHKQCTPRWQLAVLVDEAAPEHRKTY